MVQTEVDIGSVWRGVRAMRRNHGPVNWSIRRQERGGLRWWIIAWTPVWHEGRGPYVSIGLGIIAIYRGY